MPRSPAWQATLTSRRTGPRHRESIGSACRNCWPEGNRGPIAGVGRTAAHGGGRLREDGAGQHQARVPVWHLPHDDQARRLPVPPPGPHPGLLRKLRLALVRRNALGPGAAAAGGRRHGARGRDPGRAGRPVRRCRPGGRGGVHHRPGWPGRAPLWLGLGARPDPRDGDMGRPGRPEVGRRNGPTGRNAHRLLPRLAGQGDVPGPAWGARQQCVRAVPGSAVRHAAGRIRRPGAAEGDHREGGSVVRQRRILPR